MRKAESHKYTLDIEPTSVHKRAKTMPKKQKTNGRLNILRNAGSFVKTTGCDILDFQKNLIYDLPEIHLVRQMADFARKPPDNLSMFIKNHAFG